jgi:hypothetical protein
MNVPTQAKKEYALKRARVGLKMSKSWFSVKFEYDFIQPDLKYSYVKVNKRLSKGNISFLAGKFLNPLAYLWPGPKTLPLTRYTVALNDFSIYSTGIALWYRQGKFMFRTAHYGQGEMSGALTYDWISIFWEKGVGYGLVIKNPFTAWFFHPFIGATRHKDGSQVYFLQNYIQLPYKLRFYFLYDIGDDESLLIGFNEEFFKNSFIKFFYETKDKEFILRITFAFN